MVKRGELPGYGVIYTDGNGVMQTIPGQLWRPDLTELQAKQISREADEQRKLEESARRTQEIGRRVIEGVPAALDGAGMQNSPLMAEPPAAPNIPAAPAAPATPSQSIRSQGQQLRQDAIDNGILPMVP